MIHTSETVGETKSIRSKQREALQLIAKWKQYLHLTDWEVGLSTQKPSQDHDMEIAMTPTRKHAALRINTKCWQYPEEKFNYLLIHELLHIIFEPIEDAYIGKAGVYYHKRQIEVAIDHIAKVVYDNQT